MDLKKTILVLGSVFCICGAFAYDPNVDAFIGDYRAYNLRIVSASKKDMKALSVPYGIIEIYSDLTLLAVQTDFRSEKDFNDKLMNLKNVLTNALPNMDVVRVSTQDKGKDVWLEKIDSKAIQTAQGDSSQMRAKLSPKDDTLLTDAYQEQLLKEIHQRGINLTAYIDLGKKIPTPNLTNVSMKGLITQAQPPHK